MKRRAVMLFGCLLPLVMCADAPGVYDALRGATTLAAEYLGQAANIGRIPVGMEADLLLLRGNPLQDIAHTRAIDAVLVNGERVR